MIESIFKAIFDKFSATNDFKTAINGRLYAYEAPQNVTYPYCVFQQISGVKDRDFNNVQEDVLVQFTLVDSSDSIATIADAETKLYALFDEASLAYTGYTHITMERESNVLMKVKNEDDDNISYWNAIITYRVYCEKS